MLRSLLAAAAVGITMSVAATGAHAATGCVDQDLAITANTTARAEAAVVCLVNRERAARNLSTLAVDPRLAAAAQGHTDEMLSRRYFDHVSPVASHATPAQRAAGAGYAWSFVGENIASGQSTPLEVMTAWMASTGHCRNVLAPEPTDIGVGATPGFTQGGGFGGTWTQLFGRPRGQLGKDGSSAPQGGCPYRGLVTGAIAPVNARTKGSAKRRAAPSRLHATVARHGALVSVAGTVAPARTGLRVVIRLRDRLGSVSTTVRTSSRGKFVATLRGTGEPGQLTIEVPAGGLRAVSLLR